MKNQNLNNSNQNNSNNQKNGLVKYHTPKGGYFVNFDFWNLSTVNKGHLFHFDMTGDGFLKQEYVRLKTGVMDPKNPSAPVITVSDYRKKSVEFIRERVELAPHLNMNFSDWAAEFYGRILRGKALVEITEFRNGKQSTFLVKLSDANLATPPVLMATVVGFSPSTQVDVKPQGSPREPYAYAFFHPKKEGRDLPGLKPSKRGVGFFITSEKAIATLRKEGIQVVLADELIPITVAAEKAAIAERQHKLPESKPADSTTATPVPAPAPAAPAPTVSAPTKSSTTYDDVVGKKAQPKKTNSGKAVPKN